MIHAYHLIFSTYGFWLPNDPRGSWSDYVRALEIYRHGAATKVSTHNSVAGVNHDRDARLHAKRDLRFEPVVFTGIQARAVGRGFHEQIQKSGYVVHACSIMPDHVHVVIQRHHYPAEQMMNLLKGAATRRLLQENIHPLVGYQGTDSAIPSVWAVGGWKVYLDDQTHIDQAIRYVNDNPVRAGLRVQEWAFVGRREGESPALRAGAKRGEAGRR